MAYKPCPHYLVLLTQLIFVLLLGASGYGAGGSSDELAKVVTGVLIEFDSKDMHAAIRTDLGREVRILVVNPELFQGHAIGTRISVRVNDREEAVKVIDVPIPELVTPGPR